MSTWLIVLIVIVALWILASMKTSRPDGTFVKGLHPYRKLLGYIMPTRNESVVYFDVHINAEPMLEYLETTKQTLGANVTHVGVAAMMIGYVQNPTMNRFLVGRRLYDRNEVVITFSMKRIARNRKAKLAAVKQVLKPGMTFAEFCNEVNSKVNVERSGKKTYSDKELGLLRRIPRPVLRFAIGLAKTLDYYNLLPGAFIEADAMYTSGFLANLGSLKMKAGYHHLFEWGTCPQFLMFGEVEEMPVVKDGAVVIQKTLHVRMSYDERIDDGMSAGRGVENMREVIENPALYLGCLAEDGSDHYPMDVARGAHIDRD